jgi:hypothetical protein
MSNRLIITDKFAEYLAIFSKKIEILSSNNNLSWNIHAENIMIPILNLLFESNFKNLNIEQNSQFPSIDLGDIDNKTCFQITSTDSFKKIKSTIEKFKEKELYTKFDKINFLFLKEKGKLILSKKQLDELNTIIESKFIFNTTNLYDFQRIHNMSTTKDISDLESILDKLELELGEISNKVINISPVTLLIFDDENDLDLAFKIAIGLNQLDIKVKHFSGKLNRLIQEKEIDTKYCQLLYDVSIDAKSTVILATKNLKTKIKNNTINKLISTTLINQHLTHILYKLDEGSSFSDILDIKPIIHVGNKDNFQYIIDKTSLELRKQNKILEIQEYEDFETIIKLFDDKSTFKEPIKVKKSKKKIGYTLLEGYDQFKSITTFYLYLYKGVNIKQTAADFFESNKNLKYLKENNLILFLSKETDQKLLNERIQNAQKSFKAKKTYYLDEFVWQICSSESGINNEIIKYSLTKNFITPEIKSIEGDIKDYDQIENWYFSEHDPILVITGGGGIGKTTLARIIADKFKEVKPNSNVIFIEATDTSVMNQLIRLSDSKDIDLYDFYSSSLSERPISRDLFRINIDNGNFLLIIDGLDEVFSKIPDFDVKNFIASITSDFVKDIGIGKILLTCRSYFWKDTVSKETHINHFEVEPFSIKHAKLFFESKFNNNTKLIEKSLRFVNELTLNENNENINDKKIMPYVVDVVSKIIESGDELLEDDEKNSSYLKLNLKNDYVIFRIFVREFKKTNQITINEQCKFFILFSVFYKGHANSEEIANIWNNHFERQLTEQLLESLKSHPILEERNGYFSFRYDFFELLFKSIYISELISIENIEKPSESLVKILLNEGKFGSNLLYEIVSRCVKNWSENYILRISDLIYEIRNIEFKINEFNSNYKNQSISSLFALALMINQAKVNNQTQSNTELLKNVFGTKENEICGLSLVQFGSIDGNIKFNFSNITLKDCHFDGYECFWDCTFNSNTKFENCTFLNMPNFGNNNSKEININQFINSRKDSTFDDYFNWKNNILSDKKENIKNSLEKFFKLFYINGYLQPQKLESHIYKRYGSKSSSVITVYEIIEILEQLEFINIEYNKIIKEKRAEFKENIKEEILQFIKEGTVSIKIKRLIDRLIEL